MELAGQPFNARATNDRGYAMAALLVAMTVMAVLTSALLPVWNTVAKREKEEELIFRGRQYARAIGLFQRKFANTPPPTIDILVEQRFLRKKYKDPITNDDFQPIYANQQAQTQGPITSQVAQRPGQSATTTLSTPAQQTLQAGFGSTGAGPQGGVIGVTSKSKAESIKLYNGRSRYNEWSFVYVQTAQRPGQSVPGQQQGPPGQQPFGMNPGNVPGGAREIRGPNGERGFEVPRPGFGQPNRPPPGQFPGQAQPFPTQNPTGQPVTPGVRRPGGQ
ncbi:MAG TPA: type II secretion system protein [Vicinamibacterales bacterium]|nr:type II secretion system protein [Vicinamibacterales bacterium]